MDNRGVMVRIAITSANNLILTRGCILSIGTGFSTIVYDDASTEPIEELCVELKVGLVKEDHPKGLTNLFNKAYKDFFNSDCEILLLTNNDVIFPIGSIENMEKLFLKEKPMVVGPLSNQPGTGVEQQIERYVQGIDSNIPASAQKIQDVLEKDGLHFKSVSYLNGFCLLFDKRVDLLRHDSEYMFPPNFINVGNDDWFTKRIYEKDKNGLLICLDSFVFHYKGKTTQWCERGTKSPTSWNPENTRENLWRK